MGYGLLALSVIVVIMLLILLVFKIWEVAAEWGKIWKKSNTNKKWIVSIKLIAKIVIIICLIGYLLIIALNMRGIQSNQLIQFLFVTEKNKFNWIGITSVLAIISLTFTAWDSRRKLKADVVSKSRVQWINSVRPLVAKFLVNSKYYMTYYIDIQIQSENLKIANNDFKQYETGAKQEESQREIIIDKKNKINELLRETENIFNEIKLNLPEDKSGDNATLMKSINVVYDELKNIKNNYKNAKNDGEEKQLSDRVITEINNVVSVGSSYFKNEWERAKKGE